MYEFIVQKVDNAGFSVDSDLALLRDIAGDRINFENLTRNLKAKGPTVGDYTESLTDVIEEMHSLSKKDRSLVLMSNRFYSAVWHIKHKWTESFEGKKKLEEAELEKGATYLRSMHRSESDVDRERVISDSEMEVDDNETIPDVCNICNRFASLVSKSKNDMCYCDGTVDAEGNKVKCNVIVHQMCYNVFDEDLEEDQEWQCNTCSQEQSMVECFVCCQQGGTRGGAMVSGGQGYWMHSFCSLFYDEDCPEHLTCHICGRSDGYCTKCTYTGCNNTVHPMCAKNKKEALTFYMKEVDCKMLHCGAHKVDQDIIVADLLTFGTALNMAKPTIVRNIAIKGGEKDDFRKFAQGKLRTLMDKVESSDDMTQEEAEEWRARISANISQLNV